MRFVIHMNTPEETEHIRCLLETWKMLSCCGPLAIEEWSGEELTDPAIIFWDLDSPMPFPEFHRQVHALFLCSSNAQMAIVSYRLHPMDFLQKPIKIAAIERAMERCIRLWWPSMERMELLCRRVRMQLPLCQLLWVESNRRGCVLHSSMDAMFVYERLTDLESRMPKGVFARCQRSFLVNLNHVSRVGPRQVYMTNGTELPIGRGSKASFLSAWEQFQRMRR